MQPPDCRAETPIPKSTCTRKRNEDLILDGRIAFRDSHGVRNKRQAVLRFRFLIRPQLAGLSHSRPKILICLVYGTVLTREKLSASMSHKAHYVPWSDYDASRMHCPLYLQGERN